MRLCAGGPSLCSLACTPGTMRCPHTGGCSPAASTGKPRITESIKNLPEHCFLGFIPYSRVFAPAANFSNLFPAPSAHLDLLPAFVELLGAQRGLCRRHFALALLQPLPHGSNQLSEFVQLLLAGRCIPFSKSEKVSESQSSCFALQLPPRECSTVESPGARLFIIIIRCCLETAHAVPAKTGCKLQPAPLGWWQLLRHCWLTWSSPASLHPLCTGLFGELSFGEGRAPSHCPRPYHRLSSIQPLGGERGSPSAWLPH